MKLWLALIALAMIVAWVGMAGPAWWRATKYERGMWRRLDRFVVAIEDANGAFKRFEESLDAAYRSARDWIDAYQASIRKDRA